MARLKLGVGADAANIKATEGRANYTGPTPPAGLYPMRVTSFKIGTTKDKSKPMFTAVLAVDAPKNDPRAEYNGYPIFHRLVVPTDKTYEYYDLQVGQINRLVDAMAGSGFKAARQALWGDQAVIDEDGKILKVGPVNMKAKNGVTVLADTRAKSYKRAVLENGKPKKDDKGKVITEVVVSLEINDVLAPKNGVSQETESEEDGVEYEDDDDVSAEVETEEDEVDTDEEEADDEVEEDEESDETEDEEEPEEAEDEAEPEDEAEEAEPEDDDVEAIAEELPEEPEPEAPKRRTRRKAF